MSEAFKSISTAGAHAYKDVHPLTQRAIAVAAALELIAVRVGAASANGNHLDVELNRLSTYADQIQSALEIK
jgi:hypothetical protein